MTAIKPVDYSGKWGDPDYMRIASSSLACSSEAAFILDKAYDEAKNIEDPAKQAAISVQIANAWLRLAAIAKG